jgi:hypothetical protein
MKSMSRVLRSCLLVGLGLPVLASAGCGKPEEIKAYTVPKPAVVYEKNHVGSRGADEGLPSAEMVPTRLLGAIVPDGEGLWFFKSTGSPKVVAKALGPFTKLVNSLRFEKGELVWTLPEGWTRQPGNSVRYATLHYEIDGTPLEMSVIPLGQPEGDFDNAVFINVNRWRGQVSLPRISQEELYKDQDEVRKLTLNDRTAVLVNLVGKAPKEGAGMPPFAGGGMAPPPREAPLPDFTKLELPEGWSPAANDQFSKFAAEVKDGEQEARFTITTFGAGAGQMLTRNLNRWRDQVGLAEASGQQLTDAVQPIAIGKNRGRYVEFFGEESQSPRLGLFGVIVTTPTRTWFIKLKGDAELLVRERANFRKFVQSLPI